MTTTGTHTGIHYRGSNLIKITHQNIARNPVARAVARAKLHSTLVSQKIALYMMDKGDPCVELMLGLGHTLSVVGYAFEWQHIKDQATVAASVDLKILRGGLSACDQLATATRYDPMHTVAIANALDAAERINLLCKPESIRQAWLTLS